MLCSPHVLSAAHITDWRAARVICFARDTGGSWLPSEGVASHYMLRLEGTELRRTHTTSGSANYANSVLNIL